MQRTREVRKKKKRFGDYNGCGTEKKKERRKYEKKKQHRGEGKLE